MDIVARLKSFISHLQMPVTQFADSALIPRPTLSQLLNGRNKKVSDEFIGKIHSAFPQLNVLWLLFGEGDMIQNNSILSESKLNEIHPLESPNARKTNGITNGIDFSTDMVGSSSEKFDYSSEGKTPSFGRVNPPLDEPERSSLTESSDREDASPLLSSTISFPVNQDRKIVNIIVYYSDKSFESFVPESVSSSPSSV